MATAPGRPALDCPVCLEIVEKPVTLACGHHGCQPCLVEAVTISNCCPVCRKKTTVKFVKGLRVSIFIQDMVAPYLKERRRLEGAELNKELERKRTAEDQQRAENQRAQNLGGTKKARGKRGRRPEYPGADQGRGEAATESSEVGASRAAAGGNAATGKDRAARAA